MSIVNSRHTPYFDPENALTTAQLAFIVALANEANNDTAAIPMLSTGTSAPTSTPLVVGDIYVDSVNNRVYVATGTSSSADWTDLTAGGGGGEANTASNLGAGQGVFTSKVGVDLRFKSLVAGSNITLSSTSNEITINSTAVGYSDEQAQDAVGTILTDTTSIDLIYDDAGNTISAQREALTGAITAPKNSNTTALGSFTIAQLNTAVSDADLSVVGHTHTLANVTDVTMTVANLNSLDDGVDSTLHFHASDRNRANHTGTQASTTISDFTEAAQDAVGSMVDASLTYVDGTPLLQRSALTGAVTASAGSNATSLGSFTLAQLNTAISDADVARTDAANTFTGIQTFSTPIAATSLATMTATVGGAVPTPPNNTTTFLRGDGTFAAPPGGGGGTTFNDYYTDQTPDNGTYGTLAGAVNGSNTVFTVSQGSYASGTLLVWLNGQLMSQGASDDFQETTPASGTFTFVTAPATGDTVTARYAKQVTNSDTVIVAGDTLTGAITATLEADGSTVTSLGSFTLAQLNTAVSDANVARTDAANTFTGIQTFNDAVVLGSSLQTVDNNISLVTINGIAAYFEADAVSADNYPAFISKDSGNPVFFVAAGSDTNIDININPKGTGKVVVSTDLEVSDEVYGAGWNGSLEVPTKNALYDKIETLGGGGGGADVISIIFDGQGTTPTVGSKAYYHCPFGATITGWTIYGFDSSDAPVSGSAVVDIWKDTYANYPAVVGDSIAGSEKPTLSSANKNQDLSLSTFTTTTITSGDHLIFNLDSVTTCTKVRVFLHITKT